MASLILTGSVGAGMDNKEADVRKVRARLRDLGYHWVKETGKGDEKDFVKTIKFFQTICKGRAHFFDDKHKMISGGGVDGKIGVGGFTNKWLAAVNAPKWVKFYGKSGVGWMTTVDPSGGSGGSAYTERNGGYGTNWMWEVITRVGLFYQGIRTIHPGVFPPLLVRDCAPKVIRDPSGHSSHETGLDIDLRLPIRLDTPPPDHPAGLPVEETLRDLTDDWRWTYLDSSKKREASIDRGALEAQILCFLQHPLVDVIGFWDDVGEEMAKTKPFHKRFGKVRKWKDHKDHMHVRIKAPTRIEGVTARPKP